MNIAVSMTKANRLERKNKHEDAAEIYRDILAKFPRNTRAQAALNSLQKSIQRELNPSLEQQKALAAQFNAGNYDKVASTCAALLNSYRRSHFLWNTLGKCHLKAGNLDEAATCLNKACELNPKDASTFTAMGDVHRAQGSSDNALALFEKALSLDPQNLGALNNKANVLIDLGRLNEARPLLEKAVELAPENALILFNYSNVLLRTGHSEQAKTLLERAIELSPNLANAQYNLAQLQSRDGDKEAAISRFESMLEEAPGDDRTRADKLHAQAHLNDWSWVEEYQQHRRQLGLTGTACSPFAALTFEDNPDLLRLRIQAYANAKMPQVVPAGALKAEDLGADRPERLRIGYFSSDFHDHATMRLMAGLFEAHDQNRFDIIAYSYDATPENPMRGRVRKAVSSFKDISQLSDADALTLIKQDDLHIAVDLKGFTGDNRTGLFANRLAPLHMTYLGFPGTLGSTAMDYFIGDPVTCPAGSERYFEEHLLRLPHSYQVNDDKRPLSGKQYTRKDCGLPDQGFVFCSFNSSYKITPTEFDIWMRLLDQVEDSVLWLLDGGETSKANLRKEASKRGQDPDRLVFAPRIAQEDHLARHRVADLFLDTFVVNAHTTASDALWAGLPVLTLPGRQFASRVGASLVSAMGQPEMIAKSPAEYEARALELAQDLDALAKLRSKVQRNRRSTPLFDTKGFTRSLERGFDMAYARYLQGLPPAHLEVSDAPAAEMGFAPTARPSPTPTQSHSPL
jgi:predicted O-linked N-acetylglucosamine transferase (SPINDLY family)